MQGYAPDHALVVDVASKMTNSAVLNAKSLPSSQHHFVYQIESSIGQFVMRMCALDRAADCAAALAWRNPLRARDIPVARIFADDLSMQYSEYAAMVMEPLPGKTMASSVDLLTWGDHQTVGTSIADIQKKVGALSWDGGFGFANPHQPDTGYALWSDFLFALWGQHLPSLQERKVIPVRLLDIADAAIKSTASLLDAIEPALFLWDVAGDNVLVHNGAVSGITGNDYLMFGDPLFAPATTEVVFSNASIPPVHLPYWLTHYPMSDQDKQRYKVYQLIWCARLMHQQVRALENGQPAIFFMPRLERLFKECLVSL